jgi:hypothetical protein
MSPRSLFAGCCLILVVAIPARPRDEPKKADEYFICDLSMEVQALRLLRQLDLTDEQLRALQKVAGQTAQPARERKGRASKDYQDLLQEVHEALADPNDDDRIGELDEKLGEQAESEKPEIDDGVEVTDAARRHAPLVFRQLKAPQLVNYLGQVAGEVADPLDKLLEALEKVRGLKANEWREQRDGMLDEICNLVAGVEVDRAGRLSDQMLLLLCRARLLTDEELKSQRPELEKTARQIIGDTAATDVLRNVVERTLAELLSNPRLEAALKARLK